MSASKSIMPRGTRLVAVIALALAVCLMAWRATTYLTDNHTTPDALPPAQAQLVSLLKPVLGEDSFRLAMREADNGVQTFLILLDGSKARLDPGTQNRLVTILETAAGYDATRDRLDIQNFAFAPGTAGDLTPAELTELGALAGLCLLLGWLAARRGEEVRERATGAQPSAPFQVPEDKPLLRAVPLHDDEPEDTAITEARKLARDNPGETARILRSWMQGGDESA